VEYDKTQFLHRLLSGEFRFKGNYYEEERVRSLSGYENIGVKLRFVEWNDIHSLDLAVKKEPDILKFLASSDPYERAKALKAVGLKALADHRFGNTSKFRLGLGALFELSIIYSADPSELVQKVAQGTLFRNYFLDDTAYRARMISAFKNSQFESVRRAAEGW
jgi:hypothetical protein